MDGLRPFLVHARVVLEGRPLAQMPRQILHGHDVCLPLEEMRHEGLPENVVRDVLLDAETRGQSVDLPPDADARSVPPEPLPARYEEGGFRIVATFEIFFEPMQAAVGEEDLLGFLGLYIYDDGLLIVPIDIFPVHGNGLADPHAGRIENFEQGLRAEARMVGNVDGIEQPLELILGQVLHLLLGDSRDFDVLPAERDILAGLLQIPQHLAEHDDAALRSVLAAFPPRLDDLPDVSFFQVRKLDVLD